jgi:hypothetical protein
VIARARCDGGHHGQLREADSSPRSSYPAWSWPWSQPRLRPRRRPLGSPSRHPRCRPRGTTEVGVPSHRTWPGSTPLTCGGPDSLRRRPAGCLTECSPRSPFSRRCLTEVGQGHSLAIGGCQRTGVDAGAGKRRAPLLVHREGRVHGAQTAGAEAVKGVDDTAACGSSSSTGQQYSWCPVSLDLVHGGRPLGDRTR